MHGRQHDRNGGVAQRGPRRRRGRESAEAWHAHALRCFGRLHLPAQLLVVLVVVTPPASAAVAARRAFVPDAPAVRAVDIAADHAAAPRSQRPVVSTTPPSASVGTASSVDAVVVGAAAAPPSPPAPAPAAFCDTAGDVTTALAAVLGAADARGLRTALDATLAALRAAGAVAPADLRGDVATVAAALRALDDAARRVDDDPAAVPSRVMARILGGDVAPALQRIHAAGCDIRAEAA